MAQVHLEAPLPLPRRNVFCIGRNYQAHAAELAGSIFKNQPPPADMPWPIVFSKVPESVVGTGAEVQLPVQITQQVDYEAELAVIIGKGGKNIAAADALALAICHAWRGPASNSLASVAAVGRTAPDAAPLTAAQRAWREAEKSAGKRRLTP